MEIFREPKNEEHFFLEPQNPQNHRVVQVTKITTFLSPKKQGSEKLEAATFGRASFNDGDV